MSDRISFCQGKLQLDLAARQLLVDGRPAPLGGRGFDVLATLVRRQGGVCSRDELLTAAWPGMVVEENNLHVQVKALRRLLGSDAIVSVRGRGYAWTLRSDATPRHALFGRAALLAHASALLAADATRLLTLHGPGGVGKTRLARALVDQQPTLRDGHHVVELAPLNDGALLAETIARALGLQSADAMRPIDLLCAHLAERRMLLLLDNVEHLPGVAALLGHLLAAAPGLKVLCTGRSRLKLEVESALEVPPLPVPALDDEPTRALESPALRLFMQRAAEVGSPMADDPHELRAAITICRRLDGLPLALELAAARLRLMSTAALNEQLGQSLRIVGAGADVSASRQRSLHDTLIWSAGLLSPGARQLLMRLGVFHGGFTLDAALAVCGDDADAPDRATLLDRLTELLDVHLLQRHDLKEGGQRYTMLETVHQFAVEALEASGERDDLAQRHANWFTQVSARHDRALRGAQRQSALQALAAEQANLRAALRFALRRRPGSNAALRLVGNLSWWWYFAGTMIEGRQWQDEALALAPPGDAFASNEHGLQRARALSGACKLAFYLGDSARAVALGREAVALARNAGDRETLAYALFHLALPTRGKSNAECVALHDEARRLFQRMSDAWGEALAVSYGGIPLAFDPQQQPAAQRRLAEGRRMFSALGDAWGCNVADQYLSVMALRRGDLVQAQQHAQSIYQTSLELDDGFRTVSALHQLARVAIAAGRFAEAESMLVRAVQVNADQGRYGYAGRLLQQCARLLARRGKDRLAARVFGAASVDRGPMLMPVVLPEEIASCEAARDALRERLGGKTFEACHAEGLGWRLGQAIEALRMSLDVHA